MTSAPVRDSLESLRAAVDELFKQLDAGELASLDEDELVEFARDMEGVRRQLQTADYPLVGEFDERDTPEHYSARNTASFLSGLWRITPHEAHARVKEAHALAPRTTLTGQLLDPLRPRAAAARELGILSRAQTSLILKTLDALPRTLPIEDVDGAEQILVDAAHALNPIELRTVAVRLLDTIDPDGPAPSDEHHQRRRELGFRDEYDGMVRLSGLLEPETAAKTQALINGLSAPRPDDVTGPDQRSAAQRRHDALAQLVDLGLRAEDHAADAGAAAMLHLTMTAEQFENGTGHAVTTFGQRIRVAQAFRLTDQACVGWVVHNSDGGILNYGRSRRLASKAQVEALIARDGGCASPDCLIPAEWCERHHILEWQHGGETNLNNLVLLCAYHHRRLTQHGWTIQIRNGVPWFIPPQHIDPQRRPLRNLRGLNAVQPPVRQ